MARHKDFAWNLPEGKDGVHSWESIHAALLMDVRDELKRMNDILHCHNTIAIPATLRKIDRRLAKKLPLR